MLIVHKIIDCLRSKGPLELLSLERGESISRLADSLELAEKFEFIDFPFENRELEKGQQNSAEEMTSLPGPFVAAAEVAKGNWDFPRLSEEERRFWLDGYIPLPAPVCWFEFTLGGTRSGMLVEEDGDTWSVTRVDLVNNRVLLDGIICQCSRSECFSAGSWQIEFFASKKTIDLISNVPVKPYLYQVGALVPLAVYMALLLNSKSTEVTREVAPTRLNKKRAETGKTPLFEHHVVRIVPVSYLRQSEEEARNTHRSPRLHWRRSHLRRFDHQTSLAKWSTSEQKWLVVIPRCLIGKAELGEISHEYRMSSTIKQGLC